jgi:uncharacterized protein YjbI with pentapeptide repeats
MGKRRDKKVISLFSNSSLLRRSIAIQAEVSLIANQEHLDVIKQGSVVWNSWRVQHPESRPNLTRVNLTDANFIDAYLTKAFLHGRRPLPMSRRCWQLTWHQ